MASEGHITQADCYIFLAREFCTCWWRFEALAWAAVLQYSESDAPQWLLHLAATSQMQLTSLLRALGARWRRRGEGSREWASGEGESSSVQTRVQASHDCVHTSSQIYVSCYHVDLSLIRFSCPTSISWKLRRQTLNNCAQHATWRWWLWRHWKREFTWNTETAPQTSITLKSSTTHIALVSSVIKFWEGKRDWN